LAFSIPGVIGDLGVTGVTWRVIGYRRSKARQQSSLNMAKTRREPRLKGWHGFSVPRFCTITSRTPTTKPTHVSRQPITNH
jgi:hypothetical protein